MVRLPFQIHLLYSFDPVVCWSQLGNGKASGEELLDVQIQAKDSGMMIVTTLTPNLEWTGGSADLAVQCALSPSVLVSPLKNKCRSSRH
jgi:hypothetical protein